MEDQIEPCTFPYENGKTSDEVSALSHLHLPFLDATWIHFFPIFLLGLIHPLSIDWFVLNATPNTEIGAEPTTHFCKSSTMDNINSRNQ